MENVREGGSAAVPSLLQSLRATESEVARVLQICNACRYCEGFCAVFPAMTRRLEFGKTDVHYLANLCHDCGACLHACQYAAPHEFDVNVPRAMSRVRVDTYAAFAWPSAFGALYRRNGVTVSIALALGLALFVALAATTGSLRREVPPGQFYAVFPHGLMVALFGAVFAYAILALVLGVRRFWRGQSPGPRVPGAAMDAAASALRLRYLDGGHGEGCNEADDRFTLMRRRWHHVTFYGFLLCLAATIAGTLYHYALAWPAPYPYTSLPVLLGTIGGIGLLIGPAGLLWLSVRRHPQHRNDGANAMDRGFCLLLFLTSLSGFALLIGRSADAMPMLLALHLGIVMGLFLTLPYGKFAHGIYRCAALLKWSIEKRQPGKVRLVE